MNINGIIYVDDTVNKFEFTAESYKSHMIEKYKKSWWFTAYSAALQTLCLEAMLGVKVNTDEQPGRIEDKLLMSVMRLSN